MPIRTIKAEEITQVVKELCIGANLELPSDVACSLCTMREKESDPLAASVLDTLLANAETAKRERIPICQDTGMAVFFVELGQDVHIEGATLQEAFDRGVADGYRDGYLRCSVVQDPLRRVNTEDNTPAILHITIVPGDRLAITAAPKGFGSENMSAIRMFNPTVTKEEIVSFVVDTVKRAGGNPCPPMVIGVGLGGDFEQCAILAKRALTLPLNEPNPDSFYAELEEEIVKSCNLLGIGPQGFGGDTTAIGAHILPAPTHIAGLPCAVNIGCHVTRHKKFTI